MPVQVIQASQLKDLPEIYDHLAAEAKRLGTTPDQVQLIADSDDEGNVTNISVEPVPSKLKSAAADFATGVLPTVAATGVGVASSPIITPVGGMAAGVGTAVLADKLLHKGINWVSPDAERRLQILRQSNPMSAMAGGIASGGVAQRNLALHAGKALLKSRKAGTAFTTALAEDEVIKELAKNPENLKKALVANLGVGGAVGGGLDIAQQMWAKRGTDEPIDLKEAALAVGGNMLAGGGQPRFFRELTMRPQIARANRLAATATSPEPVRQFFPRGTSTDDHIVEMARMLREEPNSPKLVPMLEEFNFVHGGKDPATIQKMAEAIEARRAEGVVDLDTVRLKTDEDDFKSYAKSRVLDANGKPLDDKNLTALIQKNTQLVQDLKAKYLQEKADAQAKADAVAKAKADKAAEKLKKEQEKAQAAAVKKAEEAKKAKEEADAKAAEAAKAIQAAVKPAEVAAPIETPAEPTALSPIDLPDTGPPIETPGPTKTPEEIAAEIARIKASGAPVEVVPPAPTVPVPEVPVAPTAPAAVVPESPAGQVVKPKGGRGKKPVPPAAATATTSTVPPVTPVTPATRTPTRLSARQRLKAAADANAAEIKQLMARGPGTMSAGIPFDEKLIGAIVKQVVYKLADAAMSTYEIGRFLYKSYGKEIRPHVEDIIARVKKMIDTSDAAAPDEDGPTVASHQEFFEVINGIKQGSGKKVPYKYLGDNIDKLPVKSTPTEETEAIIRAEVERAANRNKMSPDEIWEKGNQSILTKAPYILGDNPKDIGIWASKIANTEAKRIKKIGSQTVSSGDPSAVLAATKAAEKSGKPTRELYDPENAPDGLPAESEIGKPKTGEEPEQAPEELSENVETPLKDSDEEDILRALAEEEAEEGEFTDTGKAPVVRLDPDGKPTTVLPGKKYLGPRIPKWENPPAAREKFDRRGKIGELIESADAISKDPEYVLGKYFDEERAPILKRLEAIAERYKLPPESTAKKAWDILRSELSAEERTAQLENLFVDIPPRTKTPAGQPFAKKNKKLELVQRPPGAGLQLFGGIKSRVRDIIAAYKSGDEEALNRAIDAAEGYKTAKPNAAIKIRRVLSEGITDENKLSYKLKRAISGELEKDPELLPPSKELEFKAIDEFSKFRTYETGTALGKATNLAKRIVAAYDNVAITKAKSRMGEYPNPDIQRAHDALNFAFGDARKFELANIPTSGDTSGDIMAILRDPTIENKVGEISKLLYKSHKGLIKPKTQPTLDEALSSARSIIAAWERRKAVLSQEYSEATRKSVRQAEELFGKLLSDAVKDGPNRKRAITAIEAIVKDTELSESAKVEAMAKAIRKAYESEVTGTKETTKKADAKPEDLAVNIIKHFRELGRREGRLNRRGQVEGDAVRLPGVTKTKEGGLGYTGLTAGDSRLDAAVQRAAEMTKAPREVLHRIHRFLETADSLSDRDIAVGISRIIKTAEELSSAAGTEVKPKNVAPWEDRKVRAAMQKLHANAFLDPALAAAVAVKLAKGFVKLGGGAVSKVSKFMFRGSGETLTDAGPSGEYARRIVYPMFKLEEFKLQNQFLGILNEAARLGLSNAQWEKIGKHAYQMAEYHTSLVNLTAAEQKGYDRMRAVFDAMRMEQVQDGPLINGKVPGLTRDFAPTTVLDKKVREILNNPEKDPTAADSYRLMYENWYKQFEPNASAEEIANTLNTILGKNPYRGQKTSKFNPLETAAGIGLPPGMREQNLMNVAKFYGMRTAQGLAWYRAVQKDPIAARILGEVDDGRGGTYVGPTEDVPLKEAGKYMIHDFSANPEVARALTNNPDLLAYKSEMSLGATADYDLIEKATALVNAFKLGPLTTARDIIQGVFGTIGEQLRANEIPMLYDAAVKVFSGQSEAGAKGGLRTTAAAEMAIDASLRTVLGKVADVARKYQGRDLGEKGIREVLWELGREVIKHRIDTGDTKALEFYGSKQWKRRLAEDREKFLDLAAGRFMETMQGNYGPEYLPRWLHKSQHGYLKAIFSLSRFSVERARRYRETVIEPMAKDGNILPFAKSTVLYLGIAAPLANTLVELITDRKPSNMSWGEWLGFVDKQGKLSTEAMDEFAYTVLANASLMGMGGIFSGALHNLNRARHGEKALWYSNPAAAAVEDFGKRIFDYWTAYSGEDFVKNLWKIPVETLVQETQSLREGRRLLEDRPDTGAREEAIWKRVTGQTKPSLMSPPQANPFSAATKIRRATTAAEIKEAYPQLEEMYKRYLPERAGRFTESKKEDGYYQFLVDTQGEPAARKQFESDEKRRQLDPLRKAAANAAFKSARRKRLTDHPELLEYR